MRTLRGKVRRRWLWGLGAAPVVVAGLIAVPAAAPASAGLALVTLHDVATGKCLDSNWSANNLSDPDMGAGYAKSCNSGNFQNWNLNILYYNNGSGEVMTISDNETGKCLESNWSGNNPSDPGMSANNPSDPDMGAAYTKTCDSSLFQQWTLSPTAGYSAFTLQNVATGKCLDSNASVSQGGLGAIGVPLPQMAAIYSRGDTDMGALYTKTCNSGQFQNWYADGPG